MRDLNHQLKQLCRRNRDGSHATQRDRERMLSLIADQLHVLGFRGMGARSLKPKHVEALLERWRREDISVGTIKNRMA
ncbi:MAG: integrase, partial [Sulfitobacter sp.]|nr:integrase [Sulfitobacter sp.]